MQTLSTVRIESAPDAICGYEVRIVDRITGEIVHNVTRIEMVITPTEYVIARLTFQHEEGATDTVTVHNPEVALTAIAEVDNPRAYGPTITWMGHLPPRTIVKVEEA